MQTRSVPGGTAPLSEPDPGNGRAGSKEKRPAPREGRAVPRSSEGSVAEARIRSGEDLGEPGDVVGLVDPVGAVAAGAVRRDAVRVDRDEQVRVVHEERSARVARACAAA